MRSFYTLSLAALVAISGCGRVEEGSDGNTYEDTIISAKNCQSNSPTNGYGECYGESVTIFNGEKVVEGLWSIYRQSNANRDDGKVFYDLYIHGYEFSGDGSANKQVQTDGYYPSWFWGVDNNGNVLTVDSDGNYTYQSTIKEQDCFVVTNDSETLKLCHESYVDTSKSNDAGYFGSAVKYGNLSNYDFDVVGTWSIAGYDKNSAESMMVKLDENGTTSNAGEWGVSADGKVMEIDGVRYQVYKYLEPSSSQCIAVYELSGRYATSLTWELCKQ